MDMIKDYADKGIYFDVDYVIEIFRPPLMTENSFGERVQSA